MNDATANAIHEAVYIGTKKAIAAHRKANLEERVDALSDGQVFEAAAVLRASRRSPWAALLARGEMTLPDVSQVTETAPAGKQPASLAPKPARTTTEMSLAELEAGVRTIFSEVAGT